MLRSDGGSHGGSTNWGAVLDERYAKWHCGNIQHDMGSCSGIMAGPNYLVIGEWLVGAVDHHHLSISHKDGKTAMVYTSAGNQHPGIDGYREKWHEDPTSHHRIKFGDRFIQLGAFRIGEVNHGHFSVSHSDSQTNAIFRSDGHHFSGPRTDWGLQSRSLGEPYGVTFGDRFVQIGHFRMGDVDGTHFSISGAEKTIAVFKKDGTVHYGPREDYTLFGRALSECHVAPL